MIVRAACPSCHREGCSVSEDHTQATRSEPSRSLGYSGYCPTCAVSFRTPEGDA